MKYQMQEKGQLLSDGQGKWQLLRRVWKRGYYCQTGKEKGQLLSDGQGKWAVTVRQARKRGSYCQTGKEKGELLCVIGSSYNE